MSFAQHCIAMEQYTRLQIAIDNIRLVFDHVLAYYSEQQHQETLTRRDQREQRVLFRCINQLLAQTQRLTDLQRRLPTFDDDE